MKQHASLPHRRTIMARYNKVSQELLDELLALLGKHNMTIDPEKLDAYKTDE